MNNSPGLTVIFTKDLDPEDAKKLAEAISLFGGVECVMMETYPNASDVMQKIQVRRNLLRQIYETIDRA